MRQLRLRSMSGQSNVSSTGSSNSNSQVGAPACLWRPTCSLTCVFVAQMLPPCDSCTSDTSGGSSPISHSQKNLSRGSVSSASKQRWGEKARPTHNFACAQETTLGVPPSGHGPFDGGPSTPPPPPNRRHVARTFVHAGLTMIAVHAAAREPCHHSCQAVLLSTCPFAGTH